MTSAFTANKAIEQPANGDYVNDWDVPVNADWAIIDAALGALTTLNVVSVSGTVALTSTQYRPPNIVLAGLLSANIIYQFPSGVGGFWSVYNNTTGAFSVTFASATGAGTTVSVPQGYTTLIFCDQTNVRIANTAPTNPGGSTTQVQFNNSGILSGSPLLTFASGLLKLTGTLSIAGAASGAVGFVAQSAAGSVTYTLPNTAGSSGQFLTTNGSGGLSWSNGASAGVSSFNTRSGAVTLVSGDVTGALGYTPVNPASLGTASTYNIGTSGGVVPLLNSANIWGATQTFTLVDSTTYTSAGFGTRVRGDSSSGPAILQFTDNAASTQWGTLTSTSSGMFMNLPLTAPNFVGSLTGNNIPAATPATNAVGYLGLPQNSRSSSYTAQMTDIGGMIFFTASATGTIPSNAAVAAPIGSVLVWAIDAGQTLTVAINSDTLVWVPSGAAGSRTVTGPGYLVAEKIKATTWWANGPGVT